MDQKKKIFSALVLVAALFGLTSTLADGDILSTDAEEVEWETITNGTQLITKLDAAVEGDELYLKSAGAITVDQVPYIKKNVTVHLQIGGYLVLHGLGEKASKDVTYTQPDGSRYRHHGTQYQSDLYVQMYIAGTLYLSVNNQVGMWQNAGVEYKSNTDVRSDWNCAIIVADTGHLVWEKGRTAYQQQDRNRVVVSGEITIDKQDYENNVVFELWPVDAETEALATILNGKAVHASWSTTSWPTHFIQRGGWMDMNIWSTIPTRATYDFYDGGPDSYKYGDITYYPKNNKQFSMTCTYTSRTPSGTQINIHDNASKTGIYLDRAQSVGIIGGTVIKNFDTDETCTINTHTDLNGNMYGFELWGDIEVVGDCHVQAGEKSFLYDLYGGARIAGPVVFDDGTIYTALASPIDVNDGCLRVSSQGI